MPVPALTNEEAEGRLRADIADWIPRLTRIRGIQREADNSSNVGDIRHGHVEARAVVDDMVRELEAVQKDLATLRQFLEIEKAEAEYLAVLVNAWPANLTLERMTILGAGLLTAGGVSFYIGGIPASTVLWASGALVLFAALRGLSKWERKRWNYFKDLFKIDPRHDPYYKEPKAKDGK